jgi:hypothetical protein
MEIIDNINRLLGDNLTNVLIPEAKIKIAAWYFSIFSYGSPHLRAETSDSLQPDRFLPGRDSINAALRLPISAVLKLATSKSLVRGRSTTHTIFMVTA